MKRKLWILGMGLIVLVAAGTTPAKADAAFACKRYSCADASGCDAGCSCYFVAEGAAGECGN